MESISEPIEKKDGKRRFIDGIKQLLEGMENKKFDCALCHIVFKDEKGVHCMTTGAGTTLQQVALNTVLNTKAEETNKNLLGASQ